jgi:hypothetical protein
MTPETMHVVFCKIAILQDEALIGYRTKHPAIILHYTAKSELNYIIPAMYHSDISRS